MTVEVVAMVYRSPAFAAFIRNELHGCGAPVRIVGNDPTPAVAAMCDDVYKDPEPEDWYLSRVYRCWNYCVRSSRADRVCLVNSDMMMADGWLDALREAATPETLPTARLVECGVRLRAGEHAVQVNLGDHPDNLDRGMWGTIAKTLSRGGDSCLQPGGCYMPVLIPRAAFVEIGGYPEGNVADGKVVHRMPTNDDRTYQSGDVVLFDGLAALGYKHVTAMSSVVYHMQEGEMRS